VGRNLLPLIFVYVGGLTLGVGGDTGLCGGGGLARNKQDMG